MQLYVVSITLKSMGSRRNQVRHFVLPLITRCPALFSRIFFPAFYLLSLPHPALPLFTHSPRIVTLCIRISPIAYDNYKKILHLN